MNDRLTVSKTTAPRVRFPRSINEALNMYHEDESSVFWAGGTWLGSTSTGNSHFDLSGSVISLGRVEELTRISRNDRTLNLGAMTSLNRLATLRFGTLPPGFQEALSRIGTLPIRHRATIGGHVVMNSRGGDLHPLLQILETHIETRYLRQQKGRRRSATRRLPLSQFIGDMKSGLHSGELLVKLCIPMENWSQGTFVKIRDTGLDGNMIFTSLASVEKRTLAKWRMALWDGEGPILRDGDLEAVLTGRMLPLTEREWLVLFEALDALTAFWPEWPRETVKRLAKGFIETLIELP